MVRPNFYVPKIANAILYSNSNKDKKFMKRIYLHNTHHHSKFAAAVSIFTTYTILSIHTHTLHLKEPPRKPDILNSCGRLSKPRAIQFIKLPSKLSFVPINQISVPKIAPFLDRQQSNLRPSDGGAPLKTHSGNVPSKIPRLFFRERRDNIPRGNVGIVRQVLAAF